MQAGRFNNLVSIRNRDAGQGTDGAPLLTFTEITGGSCWADIRFLSGVESIKAGKDISVAQASIRVRYRTDVTHGMRVYHGSDVYEIQAVLPDLARKQYTDLVCEQVIE